jgi:tRNA pseudouridine55 synthase
MNNDILPFWQEIGTSTSIIAKKVSEKLGKPTSHTGTLDPMASGVVLILTGNEYFNKEKYIQNYKTYNFDILFGFSTDTHDGLGLIDFTIDHDFTIDEALLKQTINSFQGSYHQKYPEFSSKKIEGKSLWEYKRLGLSVPEVFIDGEIKNIKIGNILKVKSEDEIDEIKNRIKEFGGNFRQAEILQRYYDAKFPPHLLKINLEVEMSRGLYVRGLVRDIASKMKVPGIVINLVRVRDGSFGVEDCKLLKDFFKEELEVNPKFLNPEFRNL